MNNQNHTFKVISDFGDYVEEKTFPEVAEACKYYLSVERIVSSVRMESIYFVPCDRIRAMIDILEN